MKMNKNSKGQVRDWEMTETYYIDGIENCLGLCTHCGEETDGCEPDACNYECPSCGEKQVFGLEELMVMGMITIYDEDPSYDTDEDFDGEDKE